MRQINTEIITEVVKNLCMEANYRLNNDILDKIKSCEKCEKSPIGKNILNKLVENAQIANDDNMPICQDTGMAVFFVEIGQEVQLLGENITTAINQGVREGYTQGYLRKSVVKDPILRGNTGDNTPAIIHYDIVPGDKIKITIAPKGFGSENMSKIYMLKPSQGREGIINSVLDCVSSAGSNPCPPIVVGIGIGGDFEMSAILAKKALTRNINQSSPIEHIKQLEDELLEKINNLGIGPQGLGGTTTCLGVNILTYPTHIAGMPLAVNISCHVTRHKEAII